MSSRRSFLSAAVAGVVASHPLAAAGPRRGDKARSAATAGAPEDEAYWGLIAQAFDLDGTHVVLNGGGNNPKPRSVLDALLRYERLAETQQRPHNAALLARMDALRLRLAGHLGCDVGEVAITRNTTEGLNTVAMGLPLNRGDRVLISAFDGHYAGAAFRQRAARDGIDLVTVDLPLEPTPGQVIGAFERHLDARTRLLVASHVTDGWGFVLPVRELAALAHRHGARMLVDGALSFGQLPLSVREMQCDFFATSLHKWLSAPLGTGLLFVRRECIAELWPLYGSEVAAGDVRKFEQIGTRPGAAMAAIGQAIDFHEQVGAERKLARTRYLLDTALNALADVPGVRTFTERDPERGSALARVCVAGLGGRDLMNAVRERGFYTFGGFGGEHDGVYIAPNLFNTPQQMQRFAAAVRAIAGAPAEVRRP